MNSEKIWRILIVDDEHLIRQGIKHFLSWEQEGFQIVGEASNGVEALQLIEETNPHIILTDIMMPIMDGEELTRIVKEKYKHIKVIILSSFGDFEYVRSTFQSGVEDYILKPKLDANLLLNVLNKAINKINLKEEQFEIDGSISRQSSNEKNSEEQLNLQSDEYCYLLGIDMNNYCSKLENDCIDIQNKIEEKIKLNNTEIKVSLQAFKKNVTVYKVILEESNSDIVEVLSKEILDCYKELSIFISEPISQSVELEIKGFEIIKKVIKHRFYLPRVKFIKENYYSMNKKEIEEFSSDQFMIDFKNEDYQLAFSYLESYSQKLTNSMIKNISDYKFFYENIIFTISVMVSNLEQDTVILEEEKLDIFNRISEANCANDVQKCLLDYIKTVKQMIIPEIQQEDTIIQQILLYIETNFHEPLNLKNVSKEFHFNPSYLSSYFATNYKEGFNEYLNKIRVEEASKLLRNSKIPISEISERVGYSDHSYFCKVFKKQKGKSPSSFRRNR